MKTVTNREETAEEGSLGLWKEMEYEEMRKVLQGLAVAEIEKRVNAMNATTHLLHHRPIVSSSKLLSYFSSLSLPICDSKFPLFPHGTRLYHTKFFFISCYYL